MNRYREFGEANKKSVQSFNKSAIALNAYTDNIAGDSSGTSPEDYFDEEDARKCRDFLSYMKDINNPGSRELELKKLESNEIVWRGEGYLIGVVSANSSATPSHADSSLVYLCTDYKLRVSRDYPLFRSMSAGFSGYGNLPDLSKYKYHKVTPSYGLFLPLPSAIMGRFFKKLSLDLVFKHYIKTATAK